MKAMLTLAAFSAAMLMTGMPSEAETLEFKNGTVVQGKYVGGTSTTINVETAMGVLAAPVADIAVLRFVDAPFHEMTLQQWDTVMNVNLRGGFLCAREAVREFLRRGIRPGISVAAGKIIFISSVHDIIPWAGRELCGLKRRPYAPDEELGARSRRASYPRE